MRLSTVLLTIPVVVLLLQPLWAPQLGAGVLGEVTGVGPIRAAIVVVAFFGAVALYVLSLQRLLANVTPQTRARSTRSIWLMCFLPFNFVEDFHIIADVGASLRRDGRLPSHVQVWISLGFTWCALQIASLFPGAIGLLGGGLGLVAWIAHWIHTSWLSRRLGPTIAG